MKQKGQSLFSSTLPANQLFVGVWKGDKLIVEDDNVTHDIEMRDVYHGECLCLVRNYRHKFIKVQEEIKLN